MQAGNAGLAFLLNLLVARLMGIEGLGIYSLSMALMAFGKKRDEQVPEITWLSV